MKPGINTNLCKELKCKKLNITQCELINCVTIGVSHNNCPIPDNCLFKVFQITNNNPLYKCSAPKCRKGEIYETRYRYGNL